MKIKKETKTLAEAIEKDVQAVVNPATAGAMETTEQNKKIADDNMKEAEKASEELAKNEQPDAHQGVPAEVKANFKKLHLAESLDDEGACDDLHEDEETFEKSGLETVSYKNYSDAYTQLRLDFYSKYGRDIEFYNVDSGPRKPVSMGVNWSAIGTVTPDVASDFADKLIAAADAARNFKYNGCKIVYGEDESLNEAVEESTFSKLYGDLVQIPYVDRFVRTKFSKDEKQVDLTIILDDYIDMDAVYDVLDQYADKIVVDEDDEELHIHIDMSDEERNTDIPNDLFDEIMTQLTAGGRLIPGKGKGYVSDYGAGYDEVSQIANADGDKGIVIRILPGHEADRKGHISTFEPAKAIADKYKDLGVYTTERTEIEKTSPHRVTRVMTIWIPEGAKAAGRDERVVKKKKEESVESCEEEKPIEEAVVKTKLDSFRPWEGAIDTFDRIKRAGKLPELENLIDELYGGEINEDELNDTLWFEADWVLETLGVEDDDSDLDDGDLLDDEDETDESLKEDKRYVGNNSLTETFSKEEIEVLKKNPGHSIGKGKYKAVYHDKYYTNDNKELEGSFILSVRAGKYGWDTIEFKDSKDMNDFIRRKFKEYDESLKEDDLGESRRTRRDPWGLMK